MNINHERLVPGSITYWGDVLGDITDQQDLVDYIASHGGGGGGDATWGNIQGTLSDQTDLNNRLTDIDNLALEALNDAKDVDSALGDHIAANDAAFAEAFSRISALEQGGGGGGVTPEEFNAHKAQNAAEFQIVDGRLTALEQGGSVSQQDFINHVDQNDAAFAEAFDRINALEQGGSSSASWGSITGFITDQQDLMTIVGDFESRIQNLESSAIVTEQCEVPGLTDYTLSGLTWFPTLYTFDDQYTGDDGEHRKITSYGSYFDEDDDYRIKFGKVNTTYEQDPNTQEYVVTGQTFSEMMTLTRREGIELPVVDRQNASIDPDNYSSAPYIFSMNEAYNTVVEDGNDIRKKSVDYLSCEGDYLCQRHRTYREVDGEWEEENIVEYQPAWVGGDVDVLWRHDLGSSNLEVPTEYPMSAFYELSYEDGIGALDYSTWEFNGYKMDENYNLGKYKIEGVEEDPENSPGVITYQETFIPYIAAEVPSTDGTYVLKATVQDGQVTYSWVPENAN